LPGEDDQIHLNVFALSAFTSAAELLQSLRKQLAAFKQQLEKPGNVGSDLVLLTGFPSAATAPARLPHGYKSCVPARASRRWPTH
jgi:hypothetical protein